MVPVLFLVVLALLTPVTPALDQPEGPSSVELGQCGPPCGEINPRLIFQVPDLPREAFALGEGESRTFEGTLTYWFDADDEGYTPPDPQQPIEITFSFPKLAPWAEMSIEPTSIPVDTACATCFNVSADDPAAPQVHFEQRTPITITLTIVDAPERTPGYEYGKLQLFAKSTESGIYNPGYGIREFRIEAAAADGGAGLVSFGAPAPSVLLVLGALAVVAGAAAWRRR